MRHKLLYFQILCKLWQIWNSPCRSRYCNGYVSIGDIRENPTDNRSHKTGRAIGKMTTAFTGPSSSRTLTDNCNKLRVGVSTIMLCCNSERVRYLPKPSYTYKPPTNGPIWLRHCIPIAVQYNCTCICHSVICRYR